MNHHDNVKYPAVEPAKTDCPKCKSFSERLSPLKSLHLNGAYEKIDYVCLKCGFLFGVIDPFQMAHYERNIHKVFLKKEIKEK